MSGSILIPQNAANRADVRGDSVRTDAQAEKHATECVNIFGEKMRRDASTEKDATTCINDCGENTRRSASTPCVNGKCQRCASTAETVTTKAAPVSPLRLSKPDVLALAFVAAHPGATPEEITVGTFNRDTGRVRARTKTMLEQLRRAGLIEREPGRAESRFTLTARADAYIKPFARRGN